MLAAGYVAVGLGPCVGIAMQQSMRRQAIRYK